jgi:hypothetical protein
MTQQRVGSLEIDQDLQFQRREWTVQRVAWAIMLLIVVGAVAGLFATGPLSSASATTDDGALSASYGRFGRHEAYTSINLEVSSDAVQADEVRIFANHAFLDTWTIESITPEPDTSELVDDGITWSFTANLTASGEITIRVKPERVGIRSGEIGLADGERVTIRQLVYP